MSAPKHTAGPWHADGYYVFPAWQAAAAVARVRPNAQAFADARLIAAAPDLLEAAQGARIALNAWATVAVDEYPNACRESAALLAIIDAAIAKATGEGAS